MLANLLSSIMAPSKGLDFARNQLLKYGWKEGKGLGRNESGITDAIRPKLKFDTQGIGHNASEQFTYHWWEHAFNQAASNIQVASSEEGVKVNALDDSVDITTKKYSMQNLKKNNALEYGTFLKTSTLTKGGQMIRVAPEIPEDTNEPKDASPSFESLTDEDLFKICGGRTAHKGARHGMKLNGKLARIQEQEKLLLAKFQSNKKICTDNMMPESNSFTNLNEETEIKVKNKNKRMEDDETSNPIFDTSWSKKIKHKKKDKIKECLITAEDDIFENNASKKVKKSKRKNEVDCIELENKKSKKERKHNDDFLNYELENVDDEMLKSAETTNNENTNARHKKKKKRKNKISDHEEIR